MVADEDVPRSVFYDFPSTGGAPPAPRWGHAAAAVGECLYVFGGVGATVYDNAFCYDAVRAAWRAAVPAGGSRKEARPCFSQRASAPAQLCCSCWAVLLALGVWDAARNPSAPGVLWAFDLTGQRGAVQAPPAMFGAAAAAFGQHVVLFGGRQGRKYMRRTYVLDTGLWLRALWFMP